MKYTRKLFVYLIAIIGLSLQYNPAYSSPATYTNGRLTITALDIGGEYLQVELRQLNAINWFILDSQTPIFEPSTSDISTLSSDGRTINVPSLILEGITFSAEFTVIGQASNPKLLLGNLVPVGKDLGFIDFNEVLDFRGETGPQGATGLQGPQGETGPQGATGLQGPQGETGPQGAIGLTGAQGAAGEDTPASHSDDPLDNTSVGIYALNANPTGTHNTALGDSALRANTIGTRNTASGSLSLYVNQTGSNNSAHGSRALRNNVSDENTASGRDALYFNTFGTGNTAHGFEALKRNTIGSFNTAVGWGADVTSVNSFNATAIGFNALVDANNKVRIGNAAVSVIEGQVAFTSSSDIRLKEQIKPITDGLDFINDLNPVRYHRIGNVNDDMEMGLLAQDVAATLEKHGFSNSGMVHQATQDAYMSLRYNDLFAPMIRAIQELDIQNSMLKQELDRLRIVIENPRAAR